MSHQRTSSIGFWTPLAVFPSPNIGLQFRVDCSPPWESLESATENVQMGKLNVKAMFRIIRQPLLWIALFRLIALSQASAQDKVWGTPMEHVNLRNASVEQIHQVAEKDANLVWSLIHLPDPITHKVSTITHNDVKEKAATFRVYARLHQLEGDDAAAYVDWALDRLDKLRLKEHH